MNFLRNRRSVVLLGTKNWRLRTGRSKNASAKSRSSAEITSPELPDPDAAKPRNSSAGTSLRERVLGLSSAAASTGDSELATDNQSVDRASAPRVDGDASHSTGLRATAVQAASIDDAGFNSDPDAILKRPSSGVDDLASMNKKAANPSSSEPDKEPLAANSSAEGGSASVKKSAVAHLDIKVPKSIDKYTIGGRLGSGTCGVVHKALDEVLGREVAIKLSPVGEPVATNGKVPGAQRAYQTEVFAAGRLRHPNVITVYDAGQHDDLNYFVMEAIDGVSLKHYGKGQKLLPVYRALEIICDCCMALDYIHRQDILHRDIKPANIMVARDGTVKLLDFGIAVGLSESSGLSQRGPTLGTPNYMSPEQILGKELGPASDFYSLGTVLFELLTGKQLFKAKKVKDLFKTVVHQSAPELREFRPELPDDLSAALSRVLQKKPERRFQSGVEMIDALTRFIDHFRAIEDRPVEDQALIPQLRSLPFFESFSSADIARLTKHAPILNLSAGEEVLEQGNANRELLVLVDGCVRALGDGGDDAIFGPGECIGELGFIHGTVEPRRYRALNAMRVLHVGPDALSSLPPKLHLHYYKRISDVLVRRMSAGLRSSSPDIDLC